MHIVNPNELKKALWVASNAAHDIGEAIPVDKPYLHDAITRGRPDAIDLANQLPELKKYAGELVKALEVIERNLKINRKPLDESN